MSNQDLYDHDLGLQGISTERLKREIARREEEEMRLREETWAAKAVDVACPFCRGRGATKHYSAMDGCDVTQCCEPCGGTGVYKARAV